MTNLLQNTTHSVTSITTIGPFSYAQFGSGLIPVILGTLTGLPIVNPAFNTNVSITLTMSGIGTFQNSNLNDLRIGLFQGNTYVNGYSVDDVAMVPIDWGAAIPTVGLPINPLNYVVTFTMPIATYQAGDFGFGILLFAGGNFLTMNDLNMRFTITYNA